MMILLVVVMNTYLASSEMIEIICEYTGKMTLVVIL